MNVNAVARRLKGIDLSFVRGSCELAAGSTELLLDRLRFRVARDASGVRRKAADARVRVGAIPPTPIGSSADADGSNGLHAPHLLGELDHFGRLVVAGTACESGFPKGLPQIAAKEAKRRSRSRLELFCAGSDYLIRKQYFGQGASGRFRREVKALSALKLADVHAPRIVNAEPSQLRLTMEYAGVSLELELIEAGAGLRGPDLEAACGHPLSPLELQVAYYEEGSRFVELLPAGTAAEVLGVLRALHEAGVTLREVSYSNLVRTSQGDVVAVDFDAATVHSNPRSVACLIDRDRDLESYNRAFGAHALTRRTVADAATDLGRDAYAGTRIGAGVTFGRASDPTTGLGKWHFLLRRGLPDVQGRTVLSLGANNASTELQLLRKGAARVVCYEADEGYLRQARFLRDASEWADNRRYQLELRPSDMRRVTESTEDFDISMALCSLYYLNEEDMELVARHLVQHSAHVVLQCNVRQGIDREDADQYRRASVPYARSLLLTAGCQQVRVFAPRGYSRPLVIGTCPKPESDPPYPGVVRIPEPSPLPVPVQHV